MNKTINIIETARYIIEEEAKSVAYLKNFIDEEFEQIVSLILASKGRLIITGIGKSANIGAKIVATLNSTGTPAIFMHAADAIHGDLGIIQKDDIVLCISKSGNTPEIKALLPLLKMTKTPLIAMVGHKESMLAKEADYVINTYVEKEACSNNLLPTSSTTAQLVMGDALAVCLLESKGFTLQDFAKYHPGGMIGKNLYLKVEDLMKHNPVPIVHKDADIKKVIIEITTNRLGATAVVDNNNYLFGIITDGDIRRMLERHENISNLTAKSITSHNPKTITKNLLAVKALDLMKSFNITQLIVLENKQVIGFIHLHDILKEGFI